MKFIPLLIIVLVCSISTIIYQNIDKIRQARRNAICRKIIANISKEIGYKVKFLKDGNVKVGKTIMTPIEFSIFYEKKMSEKGFIKKEDGDFERR